ncbi:HPF/RaiA family ribosome-associated protein [Thioalbus denitrificans]|uniref:Sigma 54 modulation/S30EA-like ribosomal protein n=1 Tax=Thioalbus denitrificans TaxID=547122 RepID=A0A369CFD1_9GAMM|nr:HPF/RaiA family ribosome-associated protein [Thioalbus denitrificans]RCX32760.1 sigma 54 modulation/S30EA-like ribosomal protein [Thioalbus denitrificans]
MHIDIQALGFALTEPLREQVERRVRLALTRHGTRVRGVSVRLEDRNGSRGGPDLCCRVRVRIKGQAEVVIEDREADLHRAISRALDRAGRAVERQLARPRWSAARAR